MTSAHILRGSRPAGVIVQHAPGRVMLGDFPMVAMPTAASEVKLIESFIDTKVIGITVNHEHLTDDEIGCGHRRARARPRPSRHGPAHPSASTSLVDMVLAAFPALAARATARR